MDEKQISKHGSLVQDLISSGLEIHSTREYVARKDQIDYATRINMVKYVTGTNKDETLL